MSGETEDKPSGWTTDTLRAFLLRLIDDLGARLQRQIDSLAGRLDERWRTDRRAIDKAEQGAERALIAAREEAKDRLTSHNGLIEKLELQAQRHEVARSTDAATFATRDTLTALEKLLMTRIEKLESFQAKIVGGLVIVSAIGLANFVRVWFR